MVRRVVLGRSKELTTNQRGEDVGVTGGRQISAGAAQENPGAHGLFTDSPGSTMRGDCPLFLSFQPVFLQT